MFERFNALKELKTANNGSESSFDSNRNAYVLRVLVSSLEEVNIPNGYIMYSGEIYTEDLETKICCIELSPLS